MINRFKSYFINGERSSESITQSAALIAFMGLASRLLGLVRDRVLASKFGAGDILDAYYAAFKIPDLLYGLLVLGALSAAFVPVFTSLISNDKKKQAWHLVNVLLSTGLIVLGIVSLLLYVFAPQIVSLITFGYDAQKQLLVTELTRVMLLSPLILGLSGIIGGVLNSYKKFFFYSLAPLFYNLGIIFGAVYLSTWFGPRGLAYGVVIGALLHLLVQIPETIRCGFSYRFVLDFKDEQLRRVFMLMIPRTIGLAMTQINFLIVTILASTLASGSLAIFNFANNLQSVPLGLFGISFAVASFPTLASLWSKNDQKTFILKFNNTFRKIMFFVIPLSVLIVILRAQIVRVVLGTGRFDWEDTVLTFQALGIFAISLWAQSLIPLLARSFYAIHNTKIPFFVGIFSEIVNLVLALSLIGNYGILGLVWAFSFSVMLNAILLFVALRWKVGKMGSKQQLFFITKLLFATVYAGITAQLIKSFVGADPFGPDRTFLGVFTQLSVALAGGFGMFLLVGRALKISEFEHFIRIAKTKLFEKKPLPEEQRDEVGGV